MAADRREVDSIVVTSPHRVCWDLACWLDPVEAVVFVDALAARRLVSRDSQRRYVDERTGERGYARVRRVIELMEAAAESPQESRLRGHFQPAREPAAQSTWTRRSRRRTMRHG